jgi:D-glycero-alpha-D-manno-heptose-7-phosphate kinase
MPDVNLQSRFVVTRTPLRISLFGGGSDLPSYYLKSGRGAALSFATDRATFVTVKRHTEFFDEKYRLNYVVSETVDELNDIKNNIARETLRYLGSEGRLYISTISDLPSGNGLGSSSSFCVGLLNALHVFAGQATSALDLAEKACHIEIEKVHSPIGKQDQYACALGGVNRLEFMSNGTVIATRVPNGLKTLQSVSRSCVLLWTGVSRSANAVLAVQDERNQLKSNQVYLDRMVRLADDAFGMFCRDAIDAQDLGAMLDEGWRLKKGLTDLVSNGEIDSLYADARGHGAYGGKLLGAGGGGFLLLVFPPDRFEAYLEKIGNSGTKFLRFVPSEAGSEVVCHVAGSGA